MVDVRTKRALFWGWAVALFVVDQLVKLWTRQTLRLEESRALWPNVFEIRRANNEGVAFGMLQGKGVWMTPIAVAIAVGAALYVYRHPKESRWNHVAFGLLASGAIGNLFDRLVLGRVTDMFYFRLINFPIFNVADACITIATIMLMIGWWRESSEKKEPAPLTAEGK